LYRKPHCLNIYFTISNQSWGPLINAWKGWSFCNYSEQSSNLLLAFANPPAVMVWSGLVIRCWPLPTQLILVSCPVGPWSIFFCLTTAKHGSWVLWGIKPRMTVLAWARSNLPARQTEQQKIQKNMVTGPAEPRTKNDCAGKGQQKITRQTKHNGTSQSHDSVNHETEKYGHGSQQDPKPKMTVLAKASNKLLFCSE
jgi:hypothetical protein